MGFYIKYKKIKNLLTNKNLGANISLLEIFKML